MKKIASQNELNERIIFLEDKQVNELLLLREQLKISYESIKPINFIKNTIKELITEPHLKEDIIDTSVSVATGYLSKKIVVGSTKNPIKQILGTLLQMGVTSVVSKNTDSIKLTALSLLNKLFTKNKTEK